MISFYKINRLQTVKLRKVTIGYTESWLAMLWCRKNEGKKQRTCLKNKMDTGEIKMEINGFFIKLCHPPEKVPKLFQT